MTWGPLPPYGGNFPTRGGTFIDIEIIGGTASNLNIVSDLSPSIDSTFDLGTSALQWAEAHIDLVLTDDIQVSTGAVGTPSLSFETDPDTGVYQVSPDVIGFSAGGNLGLNVNSVGNVSLHGTSTSLRIWSRDNDDQVAIWYNPAGYEMRCFLNNTDKQIITQTQTKFSSGTATAPGLSFISDPDTGIFGLAANQLGFSTAGVNRFVITSAGEFTAAGPSGPALGHATIVDTVGNVSIPAYTFHGDFNSGMYQETGDLLDFATGGVRRFSLQVTGPYFITHTTTGSAANTFINSAAVGQVQRSTSARRYKKHINYKMDWLADIELKPASFWRDDDDEWYLGFVADDLAEQDYRLSTWLGKITLEALGEKQVCFTTDEAKKLQVENVNDRALMAVMAAKLNRLEALVLGNNNQA